MTDTYARLLTEILPQVERPSRYIGGEVNAVVKDEPGLTRVALCFPDSYELGMSHLGMKILYAILNAHPDVACERAFSPWVDMEEKMRQRGLPLLSLETRRPLSTFDVVGFSLQFELSYTNVLAMLDLGGIPRKSEDRSASDPLVVAGGPCAFNPEPMAPFIDVFVLGDAEDALLELTLKVREWRRAGLGREEMLREADKARECYVPLLCSDRTHPRTGVRWVPRVYVMKRTLKDIDKAPYPTELVVPYGEVVHDRVTFEVSRGCQVGCRFCQAGIIYRPARDREVETLLPIVEKSLRSTGYSEVSLMSLNAGGYPHIHEVARSLVERYRGEGVSVALSSLRAPLLTAPLAEAVATVRKTGFTIAAECGTERLRRIINKNIKHEDVIRAAHNAFGNGWGLIKLYFMIGLPTETIEDVEAIVDLGREVLAVGREHGVRPRVNLGVSSFVPKPHTPFQWLAMERPEELRRRQDLLFDRTRGTPLKVKGHRVEQSLLECVLSRGDRSVARAVELGYLRGHRFDGWGERFDWAKWSRVLEDAGVDADAFLYRPWEKEDPLPWDHIRTGVFKGFLWDELEKALRVEDTPECGPDLCFSCGPCSKDFLQDLRGRRSKPYPASEVREQRPRVPASFAYRVTYRKAGDLRFLSHLDILRTLTRAVARARLPIASSQGFHPMPRISMGPALPVGIAGEGELCDLELLTYLDPDDVAGRLGAALPPDLGVVGAAPIAPGSQSLASLRLRASYVADVSALDLSDEDIAFRSHRFLAQGTVTVARVVRGRDARPREETKDARAYVISVAAEPGAKIRFETRIAPEGALSPYVALQGILQVAQNDAVRCVVTRLALVPSDGSPIAPKLSRQREPIYA